MTTSRQPTDIVRAEIIGALDGISEHGLQPFDPSVAFLAVVTVGDAIRLRLQVPKQLRERFRTVSLREFSAIVAAAIDFLVDVPRAYPDDVSLSAAAQKRDQMRSFEVGLLRFLAPLDVVASELSRYEELAQRVGELENQLRKSSSRQAVDRALGNRRWFLDGADWLTGFPEEPVSTTTTSTSDVPGPQLLNDLAPPEDVVVDYIQTGRNLRWVEGAAAHSAAFREQLSESIEALHESGEDLSLVAWRWLKGNAAFKLRTQAPKRLAAATHESEESREELQTIRLGRMGRLSAEATIFIGSSDIRIAVVETPGTLRRVSLGSVSIDAPNDRGEWTISVRIPTSRAEMHLSLESRSGEVYEADFELS